jgi:hypothetical protein
VLGRQFAKLLEDVLSVELAEGMLSVELVKVVHDWLWHNGRTDSMLKVGLGCFGKLVV